ncbi:uncharacterized protein L969DRAFT_95519 [Mixia osmundae IAM 14324]|uniref:Proteasome assembly chaperone 2 n=1 Tax=Mixia osmundae (strain CBS 9802 / IAM 14324 / JCM 22182 / KY 12970) TaxID=764103 RepID=G7E7N1_MIXOS|nr:uncharacterized protein L969DRAFT_95519 [Mixia osmundae IAM 14324]KEI38441.1 hypothetical protein L969DRAFT_95519 [Mixia osmundae IAM 14324]GAA98841.1 hypothetical protein E5Q_05529 [Mixia osmundae IAM 14324]
MTTSSLQQTMPFFRGSPASFDQSTLLLPAVSIGNVPQLATDLLIHSHALQKIGTLSARDLVPVLGSADYLPTAAAPRRGLATALEVYATADHSLVTLQQRSPVLKSRKEHFVYELCDWIVASRFKRVVILSSLSAGARRDAELASQASPFRYFSLTSSSAALTLQALCARIPSRDAAIPLLPSAGLTRRYLEALKAVETAAILLYVAEGDNRGDACAMAEMTSVVLQKLEVLPLGTPEWQEPKSWHRGLYGTEAIPDGLFG